MITSISAKYGNYSGSQMKKPSFGMANLNEIGRQSEDSFGYQANEFLDTQMYRKAKLFKTPAIKDRLDEEPFDDICIKYGCTLNPKANAEFIESQIISSKGEKIIADIEPSLRTKGLQALYNGNYDNPDLSVKSTKKLLDTIKDSMSSEEYIKQIGVLEAGTIK